MCYSYYMGLLKREIRCIRQVGPINIGQLGYCFEVNDEKKFFRVWFKYPILGMQEFKIPIQFRDCFKIV